MCIYTGASDVQPSLEVVSSARYPQLSVARSCPRQSRIQPAPVGKTLQLVVFPSRTFAIEVFVIGRQGSEKEDVHSRNQLR